MSFNMLLMLNNLKHKPFLKRFLGALIICALLAVIFNYSLQIHYKFIIYAFFILFLSQFSKFALWMTTIIFSLIALLFPVTLNFGIPSQAHLLNTAHTTFQEACEFVVMVLSAKVCIIVIISIALLVLYLKNGLKMLNMKKDLLAKKYYKYISLALLFLVLFLSYKCYPLKFLLKPIKICAGLNRKICPLKA